MSRENDEATKKLFHYTDEEGAKGIVKSGQIAESTDHKRDCAFGEGTYLTSKDPISNTRSDIAKNNYDGADSHWSSKRDEGKCDYAVEVDVPEKNLSKERAEGRDVYRYDGPVDLAKHGSAIHRTTKD